MNAKRLLTGFFLLIFLSLNAIAQNVTLEKADSLSFALADWQVTDLGKGQVAMSAQMDIFASRQTISVVKYRLRKHKTDFIHCPSDLQGTTSEIGEGEGAIYAINGSYFHMDDRTPATFFRKGKQVLGQTDASEAFRCNGLVAVKGKKMAIMKAEIGKEDEVARKYRQVLSSGPVLMLDGDIVVPVVTDSLSSAASFNNTRHPRSIIGYDDKGFGYLVVVDGRFPGEAEGATIYECAAYAYLLGMKYALNLDGGGSSAVWTKATGTLSHPCDNKAYDHQGERKVPNCIVVR